MAGKRLTFTGCVAASDDFGRVRLFLMDRHLDGSLDHSWQVLQREFAWRSGGTPVKIHEHVSGDGSHGEVVVTTPVSHREHWVRTAEALRGRRVKVEATIRPYNIPGQRRGVSLDLAWLEEEAK